ncbi:MAG: hypothetical protein AABX96_00950 [Nanoarchaeota archaeon]
MRRILSIGEIAEKEQRRKRIGGIVIIALLVLSTLGFALSSFGGDNNTQDNLKEGFSYNGQNWVYTSGSQKYYFINHPDEINTSLEGLTKTLADFAGKQIYVDSELVGGLQEIYNTLGIYAGKVNEVCYGSCERDLPERECLPDTEPMIIIRENETEGFVEKDNCLFIKGNLKTVDAFLYGVLGIK